MGALLPFGPAHAQAAIQLPDPGNLTLFGIGVAGLVIGRYAARQKPKD